MTRDPCHYELYLRESGGPKGWILPITLAVFCLTLILLLGCHRDQAGARPGEPLLVGTRWEEALDVLNKSDDPKVRAAAARHLRTIHPRDLARLAPALKKAMDKEKDPDAKAAITEAYRAALPVAPKR